MKKRLKGLMLFFSAALFLVAGVFYGPMTVAAYNNDVSNGVVAIVYHLKGAELYITDGSQFQFVKDLGDIDWSSGSGFFVGKTKENPQYIVTNNHVVDRFIKTGEGGESAFYTGGYYDNTYPYIIAFQSSELRVYYDDNDYEAAFVVDHGDSDKVDLAILKLRNPTDKRKALQLYEPTDDMIGNDVYVVGYPGNADNDFTSASHYGISDVSVAKGAIGKYVAASNGVERIQTDATIHHGNSGGPLVTEEGYVIGVNTNVWSNSPYEGQVEADYYSINISHVISMLDRNNITYQMAKSSSGNGLVGLFIGLGAFSVVLIILAVLLVIIIVVVVIIIVVNAVKKKKKKSASGDGKAKTPGGTAPVSKKNAQIRSMSVQHQGKTVAVQTKPVLVGRDPASCDLVFKEGTAGVSGKHCSVTFDEAKQVFYVTDLNSSYGTFLNSGKRLDPNVPTELKAGDCFYVGDNANVIQVELG